MSIPKRAKFFTQNSTARFRRITLPRSAGREISSAPFESPFCFPFKKGGWSESPVPHLRRRVSISLSPAALAYSPLIKGGQGDG